MYPATLPDSVLTIVASVEVEISIPLLDCVLTGAVLLQKLKTVSVKIKIGIVFNRIILHCLIIYTNLNFHLHMCFQTCLIFFSICRKRLVYLFKSCRICLKEH